MGDSLEVKQEEMLNAAPPELLHVAPLEMISQLFVHSLDVTVPLVPPIRVLFAFVAVLSHSQLAASLLLYHTWTFRAVGHGVFAVQLKHLHLYLSESNQLLDRKTFPHSLTKELASERYAWRNTCINHLSLLSRTTVDDVKLRKQPTTVDDENNRRTVDDVELRKQPTTTWSHVFVLPYI